MKKDIVLLHGISCRRASEILERGFADTLEMDGSMREGMGTIGEQRLTFFMIDTRMI